MEWYRPPGQILLPGGILLFLFALYTAAPAWIGLPPGEVLLTSVANVAPHALLGLPLTMGIARRLDNQGPARLLAGAIVPALPYSLLAYWCVISIFALVGEGTDDRFVLRLFPGPANSWQLLQGAVLWLVLYCACLVASRPAARVATATEPAEAPLPSPATLLLRKGDEIEAIALDRVVSIEAQRDFCRVTTAFSTFDTRRSLAKLEGQLPPERFLRVHRSAIINLDHLRQSEPAGDGGMILHLDDGRTMRASRAGARRLRDLAV